MYAERVALTRPSRPSLSERVRLATMVLGVAVAAAGATNALQWPLWGISPLLASVNTALSAAHAATAPLLRESVLDPRRQPIPWAFGIAGVCRSGTWVYTWNPDSTALHLAALLFNSSFWLLVIAALLLWSRGRPNSWERRYVGLTAIVLVGSDLLIVGANNAKPVRLISIGLDLLLLLLFFILSARRTRRAQGLERRALRMAVVPGLVVLPAALATGSLLGHSARFLVPSILGIALLVMPLTIVVTMARLAAERAEVADAVAGLSWPASPRRLQSALRRALHDQTIELGYWVATLDRFVDAEGRRIPEPAHDRFAVICHDERPWSDAPDGDGPDGSTAPTRPATRPATVGTALLLVSPAQTAVATAEPAVDVVSLPVAMLIGDAHHQLRPDLVASAIQAAGPALALAGLQAGLQAERLDMAAVHREVEESRWAERRRLEQNLHDGAQHRLAALTMRLGAASATVPLDSRAKDLVAQIQDEIREVLRELRELADGIHPSTLTEAGLGPALEAVAERFPVRVTITAPARRFPPVVEAVAYYSTTEVLTIVTRRLSVAEVRVEVSTRGGDLWVRTTGEAADARADLPGRYLAPLGSGIRAIGGELLLPETAGNTFTVAARIPCE